MNLEKNSGTGTEAIRLAVVGAGLVGLRHIEAIEQTGAVALAAIVDNDQAAEELAQNQGVDFFRSLESLLQARIADGILLATPNALHVEQGLACIAAAYPLLVEKPIALSVEEAMRLVEHARQHKVPLLVGHHRRYNPLIHRARELIDAGRLGQLRAVHANCWLYKPDHYFETAPWRKNPGAGPVFVNLIHDIDLLRYLCGEVRSVQAQTVASIRGYDNEDVAGILLRFENDVVATLSVSDTIVGPWSWERTARENPVYPFTGGSCYWLGGTEAALSIPDMILWQQADPDWHKPISKESIETEAQDPLVCQLEHFAEVIRGESEPLVSGEEGAASLRVIEAIHESAASGSTVYLDGVKRISPP